MTSNQSLGKLETVDPREIWQDEAQDFTPCLAENLSLLGEELGIDLELVSTEAKVGDFFVDISANVSGQSASVIIENQLGPTDHGHLGQLLTYASGRGADVIIWLTTEFRDEHRQALDWLNQRTDDSLEFYGVTINVRKIGDSLPAPEFRPVAFPNTWQKATKTYDRGVSPGQERYRAFFQDLMDELRVNHRFTNAKIAQPQNWHTFASGYTGIGYGAAFASNYGPRVEIYIDRDREFNKQLFDSFYGLKGDVECGLDAALEWERLENRRASRIAQYTEGSIDGTEQEMANLRAWMIERLLKFKSVFGPLLESLV